MNTIVVATDLGPEGAGACDLGVAVARATGSCIHLVHVADLADDARGPMPTAAAQILRDRVDERGDEIARALVAEEARIAATGCAVDRHLAFGRPGPAILAEAGAAGADLIVLGGAGRASRVLGSTADHVARHARVPVLVGGQEPLRGSIEGRTWLVAVDFTPASLAAARVARWLARATRGALHFVHVVEEHDGLGRTAFPRLAELSRAIERDEAHRRLRFLASAGGPEVPARETVTAAPFVDEALRALAAADDAAAVALGTHARGALAAAFLGSTSERLSLVSERPSLIVPALDAAWPRVDGGGHIRRVLCAVDATSSRAVVLGAATDLAGALGATVHVVHVLDDDVDREDAAARQVSLARDAHARAAPVELHLLRGRPEEEVLFAAGALDADLVVVGAHRTELASAHLAEALARRSPCPVLTVRV